MHGDVIADHIASVGGPGMVNVLHLRWNDDETHAMRLYHEEGPMHLSSWELNVPRLNPCS